MLECSTGSHLDFIKSSGLERAELLVVSHKIDPPDHLLLFSDRQAFSGLRGCRLFLKVTRSKTRRLRHCGLKFFFLAQILIQGREASRTLTALTLVRKMC